MTRHASDSRAAVDLLTACLRVSSAAERRRICDAARTVSPEALLDAATYHAISGMLVEPLGSCDQLAPETRAALQRRYDEAVRRHLQVTWELRQLVPILDGSGARWAIVKGPALAELAYGDAGMRSYADLDVLVEPRAFDRVLESLDAAGLRPLDRNWRTIRRLMRGELHFLLPSGVPLDLHWHLVNMYRGRMRIDTAGMLGRAERVTLGGVVAPTLDPTDGMLHLALHGTLSGADRLLWMKDIATAAAARPPDWDVLVERAVEWRIAAPVGFMLRRARAVLGAPVPAAVVDRVSPWQTARGRLTTASLLLTRSMGLGIGGAARWLVGRTVRAFDPREPVRSSNFTPAGTRADADAFVRAVVRSSDE